LAALHWETRSLPIVFVQVSDPVKLGFVASLTQPGANITGFANFEHPIGGKWLDLPVERRLPGWAERTRTPKRHFRKAIDILGKFSFGSPNIEGPETFGPRAATRLSKMTFAGSSPLSPARQRRLCGAFRHHKNTHDIAVIDMAALDLALRRTKENIKARQ
jgi:hypothetical protein